MRRDLQRREEGSSAVEVGARDEPEASAGVDSVRSAGGGDREAAGGEEHHHERLRGMYQERGCLARGRTSHGIVSYRLNSY